MNLKMAIIIQLPSIEHMADLIQRVWCRKPAQHVQVVSALCILYTLENHNFWLPEKFADHKLIFPYLRCLALIKAGHAWCVRKNLHIIPALKVCSVRFNLPGCIHTESTQASTRFPYSSPRQWQLCSLDTQCLDLSFHSA